MKSISILLSVLIIFLFASCDKAKNPYVDKEVIEELIKLQNPQVEHVAVIYNDDIYYLDNIAKAGTRITNTPNISKRLVKMSHNYKKFAYLEGSEIVIADLKGEITDRINEHGDIKSFDWSADDKTLYILTNNKIVYYGPSMNLPEITFNGMTSWTSLEVLSASVSMHGDFAYVIRGFNFLTGNNYKMIIKPANKAADIVFEENSTSPKMQYVAFSTNKRDLVLGYVDNSNHPDNITQMYVFIDFVKTDKYSFGSDYGLFTPIFNESKSFLVTGYSSGSPTTIRPAAIGFNKQNEKRISGEVYTTGKNVLYTDWK